jgi:hypothetical protein
MKLKVGDKHYILQELMEMDGGEQFVIEISEISTYTSSQRGALHVWCQQCADFLNEAGELRERKMILGDGSQSIPWTMLTFKEDVYKVVLAAVTGKQSTESQSSVDPGEICQLIRKSFHDKRGWDLPVWPSNKK